MWSFDLFIIVHVCGLLTWKCRFSLLTELMQRVIGEEVTFGRLTSFFHWSKAKCKSPSIFNRRSMSPEYFLLHVTSEGDAIRYGAMVNVDRS